MGILEEIINDYNDPTTINYILLRTFLVLLLLILGILIGKLSSYLIRKGAAKVQLEKQIRPSFIELFATALKWCIYIIFIDLAIYQIPVLSLTRTLSKALAVIPALAASLIIIALGFGIATYLRGIIEDSEITNWKTLSMYIYYFIIYVTGVYALKVALISIDSQVSNIIIISTTIIFTIAGAYYHIKKEFYKTR